MVVNKDTHIIEIQNQFSYAFPHLRLEFFKVKHEKSMGSPAAFKYKHDHTLSELNPQIEEGRIEWSGDMTVNELETYLEEKFGLHVQVYRKSGDVWIQTSVTDSWKLSKQEDKAR